LMWRTYNENGTLTFSFIESLVAMHPYYIARTFGGLLFLMGAAIANIWVPHTVRYSLLGLLGGFALGIVGLWLSRWERAPQSLHYTPNRWLVLAVTLLVTARILFGLWRSWHSWHLASTTGADTSLVASFGVAGSLAAGAVVLGYYLSYWLGIRRRLRRHLAA